MVARRRRAFVVSDRPVRLLYISQNGMLENLGQSQVLPYLRGLARRGAEIELVSFELSDADAGAIETLRGELAAQGIGWWPTTRRRDPRLRIKIQESMRGVGATIARAVRRRPNIVQGRGDFATAVGDAVTVVVPRTKLLYDCRGLIADEYFDIGRWSRDRVEYKLVKRYERRAFGRADGIVVLTDALRSWLRAERMVPASSPIEVVPCCVDLDRFVFDEAARDRARGELGLERHRVIAYAGSLGSFYREPEMARFAGIVRRRSDTPCAFLLLTPSPSDELVRLLLAEGFARDEIVVRRVAPREMSTYLSAGDVALSFIISTFSKIASSPTKVAEYLACGLPVVLNGDIGDQRDLAVESDACVVLESFSTAELESAADRALALSKRPLVERVRASRAVALERFDLESVGVARYDALYRAMLS